MHQEEIAPPGVVFGFGCVKGLAPLIDNGLGKRIVGVGLYQAGEFNRLDDVNELLGTADACV